MGRKKKQPLAGSRRRATDDQIRVLQAWIPFNQLARALGFSQAHATRLRKGRVMHKNKSP
jgi:hypothetical protein